MVLASLAAGAKKVYASARNVVQRTCGKGTVQRDRCGGCPHRRLLPRDCHLQRLKAQIRIDVTTERPAHDFPRIEIHDRRQINEPRWNPNICDVRCPNFVYSVNLLPRVKFGKYRIFSRLVSGFLKTRWPSRSPQSAAWHPPNPSQPSFSDKFQASVFLPPF